MRDRDIRDSLRAHLAHRFLGEAGTVIVDEMGVCMGDARADLVVVNGSLHGFEIKSERDTLERLEPQVKLYAKVFDFLTIVASKKHMQDVRRAVPKWCGLTAAIELSGEIVLKPGRDPKPNPTIEPIGVAELLWRDEAYALAKQFGIARGMSATGRWKLCCHLAANVPMADLQCAVRETVKRRATWRPDALRTPSGAKS